MLKQFEDKMQKSLDSMANDFMTIRAGRANPHVLAAIGVPICFEQSIGGRAVLGAHGDRLKGELAHQNTLRDK